MLLDPEKTTPFDGKVIDPSTTLTFIEGESDDITTRTDRQSQQMQIKASDPKKLLQEGSADLMHEYEQNRVKSPR
jgi:hypothetical protein